MSSDHSARVAGQRNRQSSLVACTRVPETLSIAVKYFRIKDEYSGLKYAYKCEYNYLQLSSSTSE